MTYLALNLSHYVNGVAKKHGEVSQHHVRRSSRSMRSPTGCTRHLDLAALPRLFDRYIPGWRDDN